MSPANGDAPLTPVKLATAVIVPVLWTHSKTVPWLLVPPPDAVPKRLPLASSKILPEGPAPLAPLKLARRVRWALLWTHSHTVRTPLLPPPDVVPKTLPLLSRTTPP